MSRFTACTISEMREFGIAFTRIEFNEYMWWEFELVLTFWKWSLTVRINSHV